MKNRHIIEILDNSRFDDLSDGDLATIRAHADVCPACREAFAAAQAAAILLAARGAQAFEPTPFFQTKVMAALRERQTLNNPVAAFRRAWQSARAMVALMVILVAALAVLTFVAPRLDAGSEQQQRVGTIADYTTETVLFTRAADSPGELTAGQALQAIYDVDDDSPKK